MNGTSAWPSRAHSPGQRETSELKQGRRGPRWSVMRCEPNEVREGLWGRLLGRLCELDWGAVLNTGVGEAVQEGGSRSRGGEECAGGHRRSGSGQGGPGGGGRAGNPGKAEVGRAPARELGLRSVGSRWEPVLLAGGSGGRAGEGGQQQRAVDRGPGGACSPGLRRGRPMGQRARPASEARQLLLSRGSWEQPPSLPGPRSPQRRGCRRWVVLGKGRVLLARPRRPRRPGQPAVLGPQDASPREAELWGTPAPSMPAAPASPGALGMWI